MALQVRYDIEGDRTIVQFYAALGDLVPPAEVAGATGGIELVGRHHLQPSDFLPALGFPVAASGASIAAGGGGDGAWTG